MNKQVRNIVIIGSVFQLVMQLVMLLLVENSIAVMLCLIGPALCLISVVLALFSARRLLRITLLVQAISAFLILPLNFSTDSLFLCMILLLFSAAAFNILERQKLDFGIKTEAPEVHTYSELDPRFDTVMKEFFEETKRQCRLICSEDGEPEITDNKLGGAPYIPHGMEVPRSKDGEEMSLLLQVNLREVNLPDWPRKGILEIFRSRHPDWPTEFRVCVFPEGMRYINTEAIANDFLEKPVKISLDESVTYTMMPYDDFRREEILLNIVNRVFDAELETEDDIAELVGSGEWCDLFNEYVDNSDGYRSMLGGYADFAQGDERGEGDERTETLVKLVSDSVNGLQIGDMGFVWGLISPEALRAGDFDKATFDWDCY